MTFSLLIRDEKTGTLAGAAATGSLCVGGWVLRGRFGVGLSASQGAASSTLWGESALDWLAQGESAESAVQRVIGPSDNRAWRQLSALDCNGGTAAHSGAENSPLCAHISQPGRVAAGNILSGPEVLHALIDTFETTEATIGARLIAALAAAQAIGGDLRGLKSAALLVLRADAPPLNLRVDMSADPISDLAALHAAATSGSYAAWAKAVPVPADPYRANAEIIRGDTPDVIKRED